MEKMLISLPNALAARMRVIMPSRQRSKIIVHLIEKEITKREHLLYECAAAIEKDDSLRQEMEDWDVTLQDGLSVIAICDQIRTVDKSRLNKLADTLSSEDLNKLNQSLRQVLAL
jgi:hypothetical protein